MKKLAFIFPGQGCQYVGMGKTLYDEYQNVRDIFQEANDAVGFDLKKMCFDGNLKELNDVENMMLAILTVSYCVFDVYMKEIGVQPVITAGHSLGEYTALLCSGALSFNDALYLVRLRGRLGKELLENRKANMSVIYDINKSIVDEECKNICQKDRIVQIACYNAYDQVVISGDEDLVMKVEDRIVSLNGQITPILNSPPYHSSLMEQASQKLKEKLEGIQFGNFKWPVISNVSAIPYLNENKIIDNLTMQIKKPVQWKATMDYINDMSIDSVIELGPQAVLTNLFNSQGYGISAASFGRASDRKTLINSTQEDESNGKGENIEKAFIPTVITKCLAAAVSTKNSNWNNDEYEKGVIEPYNQIQQMQIELENNSLEPTHEQMLTALNMLHSVFVTKRTPVEEQKQRITQILKDTGTTEIFKGFLSEKGM